MSFIGCIIRNTNRRKTLAVSLLIAVSCEGQALAAGFGRHNNKKPTATATVNTPSLGAQPLSVTDIRALMLDVSAHQRQLEKVRENYTYKSDSITQDVDSDGKVKKTASEQTEVFYVNTHRIERTVKKDGKPLSAHEQQKEQERITKLLEKAQKVPPGQSVEGPNVGVSIQQLLEIMEVSNPRREIFRGRPTVIFDFAGRHDAKTHGFAEDASKRIAGTLWVDERDKQVARMEAHFIDNFHVGGGLLANVAKGSNFKFDQAPVNGEIWLPIGAEGHIEARVLLLKGYRENITERDYDYEQFSVEAGPAKVADAGATPKQ